MIYYKSTRPWNLRGSVFPWAARWAVPCAIVAGVVEYYQGDINVGLHSQHNETMDPLPDGTDPNYLFHTMSGKVYTGFSTLIGFLVVFRTNQAYNRFWGGCESTQRMRAEWFEAAASIMAYCKFSVQAQTADPEVIAKFQHLIVRLFSMLHAAALNEIEDCPEQREAEEAHVEYGAEGKQGKHEEVEKHKFKLKVINPRGLNPASLEAIQHTPIKVALVFQWIQQLIVQNIRLGVMSIHPPILTRCFQLLAAGMVNVDDAMKITIVPFPFPYAQTTTALLLLHWIISPLAMANWVDSWWSAAIFTFIQVFILWSLNAISEEIENPFGEDPNDLPFDAMQDQMNEYLLLLLRPNTKRTPFLSEDAIFEEEDLLPHDEGIVQSFHSVWRDLKLVDKFSQPPQDNGISMSGEVTNIENARRGRVPATVQQYDDDNYYYDWESDFSESSWGSSSPSGSRTPVSDDGDLPEAQNQMHTSAAATAVSAALRAHATASDTLTPNGDSPRIGGHHPHHHPHGIKVDHSVEATHQDEDVDLPKHGLGASTPSVESSLEAMLSRLDPEKAAVVRAKALEMLKTEFARKGRPLSVNN